jgi:hypothetical protein
LASQLKWLPKTAMKSHLFLLTENSFHKIHNQNISKFTGKLSLAEKVSIMPGKRKEYQGQQLGAAWAATVHCKKRLSIFLSPAGMSMTKLSLAGE